MKAKLQSKSESFKWRKY